MKKFYIIALFLFFSGLVNATNCTWAGGSGNWNDPAKWYCGIVPGSDDDVEIPYIQGGNSVVTLTSDVTVHSITMGQNTHIQGAYNITVNGDVSMLDDCFIEGSGNLTIGGIYYMSASGNFSSYANATFSGRTVTLNGGANLAEGLVILNNSTMTLPAGSTLLFAISGSNATCGIEGAGTFNNYGTMVTSGGVKGFVVCSNFNNYGSLNITVGDFAVSNTVLHYTATVNIGSGRQYIVEGGATTAVNSTIAGDGSIYISSNSSDAFYLGSGCAFTVPTIYISFNASFYDSLGINPTLLKLGGSTLYKRVSTSTMTIAHLIHEFGVATIAGNFDLIVTDECKIKTDITITGTGTFTANALAELSDVIQTLTLNQKQMICNAGATMPRGDIDLQNGSLFKIPSGAVFDINSPGGAGNDSHIKSTQSPGGTFKNDGTLNKTGSNNLFISAIFQNNGTVNQSGANIQISGNSTHTNATVNVAGNCYYQFYYNGSHTMTNSSFLGQGWLEASTSLTLNTGNTITCGFYENFGTTTDASGISPLNYLQDGGTYNRTVSVTMNTGDFSLSGGTFNGNFDANVSGAMVWDNTSTISGTGVISVAGLTTLPHLGYTVTMDVKKLYMNGGGTFNDRGRLNLFNGAILRNAAGAVFTVDNSVESIYIFAGGTFENFGTLNKSGSLSFIVNSAFNNTGTVNLTGNNIIMAGGGTHTGATVLISANSNYRFTNGTHTLNNSAFSGAGWLEDAWNVNINAGSTVSCHYLVSGGTTSDLAGIQPPDFNQTGGEYDRNVGVTLNTGDFNLTGGVFNGNFDANISGNMVWDNFSLISGTGTINVTGTTTLPSLGSTVTLDAKTLVMNGGGTFLNRGTLDLNNNAILRNPAGAVFTVSNSVEPIFILSGGTFENLGTCNRSGTYTFTVNAVFQNTGTFNLNGGPMTVSNTPNPETGTFNIANGANLNLNYSGGMQFQGTTFTNNGSVNNNNLIMNGSNPTTLAGNGTIQGLTLNNNNLTITGNQVVTTTIDNTNSNATINGGSLDIGGLALPCSGSGCYFTTQNGGQLIRTLSTNVSTVFPIGYGGSYNPTTLKLTSGSNVKFGSGVDDSFTGNTNGNTYVNREWDIQQITSGSATATGTFQWNTADEHQGFDRTNCHVSRGDGSAWTKLTSDAAATAAGSGVYTRTADGITAFGHFGIASGLTLPIVWEAFTCTSKNKVIDLNWITASEDGNQGFEIQRSGQGTNWQTIGYEPAKGNVNQVARYTFTDESPLQGTNYYRLKQVDISSKYEYSSIVLGHMAGASFEVDCFPVPTHGTLHIRIHNRPSGALSVHLLNSDGRLVYHEPLSDLADSADIPVGYLITGTYQVMITGDHGNLTKTVIIE